MDAAMAEVIALREGLLLVQNIGCTQLLIQSDCVEVVETMMQDGFSATAIYDSRCYLFR